MKRESKNKIYQNLKGLAEKVRSNPSNFLAHTLCKSFSISYGLNRFQPFYNEKRHSFTQKSREGLGFSNLQRYAFILLDCHFVETALFSKFIPQYKLIIFLILEAMTGKKRINASKNQKSNQKGD